MKKNNNVHYTAIHYGHFNSLLDLAGNDKKARFLDKIIYWFRISNFTLPRSDSSEIWFTRTYKQMHIDTNIPVSTLKMYMSEFVKKGYVERKQKKMGISVRAYFRITNKLSSLLPANEQIFNKKENTEKKLPKSHTSKNTTSILPINKDKDFKKDINIISPFQGNKKTENRYNVPKSVDIIFQNIGERLTESQKTSIWGAIYNLQNRHHKKISNVAEFTAWVCFSILNSKHQLKSALTFSHQLNRLMKISKTKEGLKQPRGFYNHDDIGKLFNNKKEHKNAKPKSNTRSRGEESVPFSASKMTKDNSFIEYDLKTLKSEKTNLTVIGASLESEMKAIKLLFSNDEKKREQQFSKIKVKKTKINDEIKKLDIQIRKIEENLSNIL